MIDFELTDNDKQMLDRVREQALVCRKYARHYDENEHEFPPDALEEAPQHESPWALAGGRTDEDTPLPVMAMLVAMGEAWEIGRASCRERV